MGFLKDLSGLRFGRLTVVGFDHSKHKKSYWKCVCDCGNATVVRSDALQDKHGRNTVSCGCYKREKFTSLIDGRSKEKLYRIYYAILQRCNNPKSASYAYYGGRGIRCCFEDYVNFRKWAMLNGYEENLTIDRIDNNGNYSEENCRWVSMKVQNGNRRKYKNAIVLENSDKSLSEIAKECGISYSCAYYRFKHNIPLTTK